MQDEDVPTLVHTAIVLENNGGIVLCRLCDRDHTVFLILSSFPHKTHCLDQMHLFGRLPLSCHRVGTFNGRTGI